MVANNMEMAVEKKASLAAKKSASERGGDLGVPSGSSMWFCHLHGRTRRNLWYSEWKTRNLFESW